MNTLTTCNCCDSNPMAESQTRSGALGYCYACLDDTAYGVENELRELIWMDLWDPTMTSVMIKKQLAKHTKNADLDGLSSYTIAKIVEDQFYQFRRIMAKRYPDWSVPLDKPKMSSGFGNVR